MPVLLETKAGPSIRDWKLLFRTSNFFTHFFSNQCLNFSKILIRSDNFFSLVLNIVQCWPKSLLPYGFTRSQLVNPHIHEHMASKLGHHCACRCPITLPWDYQVSTLRPGQDGRHFPDDIFKCIFLNENIWIFITISPNLFLRVELTIFQHWFR